MAEPVRYLNNAATAWPRAPGVTEAVAGMLEAVPDSPGRGANLQSCDPLSDNDPLQECRKRLSSLFSVRDPGRIALCSNATHALNLAILGQDWRDCRRVVTSVTEHNSVLRPLTRLQHLYKFDLVVVGLDRHGALDRDSYEHALVQGVDLVVLNHASNVTGRVQDAGALFARAKEEGATTILDASQTLGHIPVKPAALHADLVAFTGHKALRGPPGTGGLYVSPSTELEQVIVGGTGVRSDLAFHPPEMPMRLEAGTPNMPSFAGLAAALRWHEKEGDAARRTEQERVRQLAAGLAAIKGVQILGPGPAEDRVPIVSFRVRDWPVEDCGYVLMKGYGIICRTGLHCAPLIHAAIGSAPEGTVRFSPSGLTTEEEIAYAVAAVTEISRSAGPGIA